MTMRLKYFKEQSQTVLPVFMNNSTYGLVKLAAQEITRTVSVVGKPVTHSDVEGFEFKPLDKIRKSLIASGVHTEKVVDEMIEGLAELPQYAKNKSTTQKAKNN